MNDLQHIPESKYGPVLVTLNPPFAPAPALTAGWHNYDHPVLDGNAVVAQSQMHTIQNKRGITFAGAWLKYGFHEDGFTSGLLAACSLDEAPGGFPAFSGSSPDILTKNKSVKPPFEIRYADHHLMLQRDGVGLVQRLAMGVFDLLEGTGLRSLLGLVGSIHLFVLRLLFGVGEL